MSFVLKEIVYMIKEILLKEIKKWKEISKDIIFTKGFPLKKENSFTCNSEERKKANRIYQDMQNNINKELKSFKLEMKDLRIRWIDWRMRNLDVEIKDAYNNYKLMKKEKIPHWLCLAILESLREVYELEKEYSKLKFEKKVLEDNDSIEKEKLDIAMIKEGVDISLIVNINPQGFCHCPFHIDKTPSMKWYPENKQFHCFSCGWHGDVIAFIMKRDNVSFLEAIRIIK